MSPISPESSVCRRRTTRRTLAHITACLAAAAVSCAALSVAFPDDAAAKRYSSKKKKKAPAVKVEGPLTIVVSLGKQRLRVFDRGRQIAQSPISSGTRSHRTPTGVFSIVQKRRRHYSNLYNSAPMPNMQRITWSGVAMHAGHLPGYPASHGCIRLPYGFSKRLFSMTKMGTRVIVAQGMPSPQSISHANLLRPLPPGDPVLVKTPSEAERPETKPRKEANAANQSQTANDATDLLGITAANAAETGPSTSQFTPDGKPLRTRASVLASYTSRIDRLNTQLEQAKVWKEESGKALKEANLTMRQSRIAAAKAKKRLNGIRHAAKKARTSANSYTARAAKLIAYYDRRRLSERKRRAANKRIAGVFRARDAQLRKALREQLRLETMTDRIPALLARADAANKNAMTLRKNFNTALHTTRVLADALIDAKKAFERRNRPITVFVSKKKQRVYVRQGYDPILQAPAKVMHEDAPIGTHVFTALSYTADQSDLEWHVITAATKSAGKKYASQRKACRKRYWRRSKRKQRTACLKKVADAAKNDTTPNLRQTPRNALDRIELQSETRERLAELIKPGSTFIISDEGVGNETGKYTDIIVQTH